MQNGCFSIMRSVDLIDFCQGCSTGAEIIPFEPDLACTSVGRRKWLFFAKFEEIYQAVILAG